MTLNPPNNDELILLFLPKTVKQLVELIGCYETQRLLNEYGGTKRYIPKKPTKKSLAWSMISNQAFHRICSAYPGETLELPKLDSFQRAKRNIEIICLTIKGVSRGQLGQTYGLTCRQIGNIRQSYRSSSNNSYYIESDVDSAECCHRCLQRTIKS